MGVALARKNRDDGLLPDGLGAGNLNDDPAENLPTPPTTVPEPAVDNDEQFHGQQPLVRDSC